MCNFEILHVFHNFVEDYMIISKLLNTFEQLILCLMRLRLGSTVLCLSSRSQISKSTAFRVISETLDILYVKLSPLIYWPK